MDQSREARAVLLPLTESRRVGEPATVQVTPETIALIVDAFYARCREHTVLGPIFNRQVHDWDTHLARIRAFWSAAILKAGGYSGRPLEAHLAIPDLAPEHFSIWLRLFRETVAAHCSPEDSAVFMTLAGRMANRLMVSAGLGGAVVRSSPSDHWPGASGCTESATEQRIL